LNRTGGESSQKKLDVNIDILVCGCYRCGYKASMMRLFRDMGNGRLTLEEIALLRREKRLEPGKSLTSQVRDRLRGVRGVEVPEVERRPVRLPSEYIPVFGNEKRLPQAVRYLESRGATLALWQAHKIGYCLSGRYAGYLVFPVMQGGKVVYFTTRFAGDGRIKSMNPRADEEGLNITKDEVLLGYDRCVGAAQVALTEGPFSGMAFPRALAGLGKDYTDRQVDLICSLVAYGTKEFVIAFDDDAVQKAQEMRLRLAHRVPKVSMIIFEKGDPWDNRANIPALLATRVENASYSTQVRSRLGSRVDKPVSLVSSMHGSQRGPSAPRPKGKP
jgi:hypothetical protein